MASAGARLLLVYAGLLVAAAGPGSRGPGEPMGSHGRQEPLPGRKLPANALESSARRDTGPPETTTQRELSLSPRDTWLWFLRHSDKEDRGCSRKLKPSLSRASEPLHTQSPPSTSILLEEQQKGPQQRLKAAADRSRALEEEEETAEDSDVVALLTQALNQGTPVRTVEAAFHCRLRRDVSVERRALRELGVYYLPQAEGAFYRGLGLNLNSGQYTVSVAGFYALAATLHVVLPEPRKPELRRPWDRLRLLICIQSRCQHNVSLETVVGLPSSSELFTISVNGILYLKRGQYTSVFLDNASSSSITVRRGSQFSAVFLGI